MRHFREQQQGHTLRTEAPQPGLAPDPDCSLDYPFGPIQRAPDPKPQRQLQQLRECEVPTQPPAEAVTGKRKEKTHHLQPRVDTPTLSNLIEQDDAKNI